MRFEVYDYRVLDGGRPRMSLIDVPPEHESSVAVWRRNGWVLGIIDDQTDHQVCVAAVDFLSDVVLAKVRIESAEPSELYKAFLIDPPTITAAQKQAIEGRGEIHFPDQTEDV